MIEYAIGLATAEDVAALPGIERRAAALFSPEDLSIETAAETTPLDTYHRAQTDDRLFVARDSASRILGFAHVEWVGGVAHLEEIDVEPEFGRQGIGRQLVEAACDWARRQNCDRITLSTFRDVPWNAPFYARLGFVRIPNEEMSPALQALREHERSEGLDPTKRIMMVRALQDEGHPPDLRPD